MLNNSNPETLWTGEEVYSNSNSFPRGYILSCCSRTEHPARFIPIPLGEFWHLYKDPDLEIFQKTTSDFTILVIGDAFSRAQQLRTNSQIVDYLDRNLELSSSSSDFAKLTQDFSGRFSIFWLRPEGLTVVNDAMGTMSTFWARDDSNVYFSNFTSLLALATGDGSNQNKKEFFGHPKFESSQPWLPGIITEQDCATPLFPNHYIETIQLEVLHRRFYPVAPLQMLSPSDAAEIVIDEMRFLIDALITKGYPLYFSITGGDDAFAMVNATLDLLQESQSIGLTYAFLNTEPNPTHDDLIKANQRMFPTGLRHRIAPMKFSWGSDFAKIYSETNPSLATFPTLAQTIYSTASPMTYFLTGHGGEIGNIFYKKRAQGWPSEIDLGEKIGGRNFASSPEIVELTRAYLEYTEFQKDKLFDFDPYDIFYWENRMGRWGARMMAEWDFGSKPIAALNSRPIISAMMSLKEHERINRTVYREIHKKSGNY